MNTLFLLLAEFETGDIPLQHIAKKYFSHEKLKMQRWAGVQQYPFPVFRSGSQKSEWLVSATEFAKYLDHIKNAANEEFLAMQSVR